MSDLFDFDLLMKWLNDKGFPKVESSKGYKVVKGIDFEKEFKAGNIRFEANGIFIDTSSGDHQVYIFISEPWITKYGSYPKFHVRECQTISSFLADGRFEHRYHVSSAKVNDLTDITTRQVFKDEELELCGYCRNMITEEIYTTADFAELYVNSSTNVDIRVDNDGYVKDWKLISKNYRLSVDYTCEGCGLASKSTIHRYYWEVDHVDGNKLNNEFSNLKCLCVRCHSRKDDVHRNNYSKGTNKIKVESFNRLYPED